MMVMEINIIRQAISTIKYFLQLRRKVLTALLLLSMFSNTIAQEYYKNPLNLDKNIRIGHLTNGFTYYLKRTSDTDKMYMQFHVKVGNYNEYFSEKGFAHLIEHLGYNVGFRESFSKNDLAFQRLETYSSAFTSSVNTEYYTSFSSNDSTTLRNRLLWFANIAQLKLEDSIVIQESRCIRQELFTRAKGLALNKAYNESVYKAAIFFDKTGETPYSSWLTTYDMGGISVSSVGDFYQRWYRPDNMGLIVTGNIRDLDGLEQQLIELYGKIPKGKNHKDEFDVREFYLSAPSRFKTIERKEVNRFTSWNKKHSLISLLFKVRKFNKNLDSKEKWLNKQLYNAMYHMIDNRLKTFTNTTKPIHSEIEKYQLSLANYQVEIESNQETVQENIQRVTSIFQEILTNGFKQDEWDKQKNIIINQISKIDTNSQEYWEEQLKNHFVYKEILPAHKKSITKEWIDNLSLDDINYYLKENFSVMPDDIYITASVGHPALSLTEKKVRRWIKEAIKQPTELKETIDIHSKTKIVEKKHNLMNTSEIKELKEVGYNNIGIDLETGLEILELNNGVKIILDSNEVRNNTIERISIEGSSPRGATFFKEDEYYTAISSTEIIKLSGAGGYSRQEIRNKMGGEFRPSAEPVQLHIQNNTSTVRVKANIGELEKYLQLVYLYFTSPRKDPLVFEHWKNQIRQRYLNDTFNVVNPIGTDFRNSIADYLKLPFLKPKTYLMSTQQFYQKQKISYEKALECYSNIFGNAFDFTFVIKGNYKKKRILPLLQKYLGNLPTCRNSICSTTNNIDKMDIESPKGPIYHEFYATNMNTSYKLYTTPYSLMYTFIIPNDNWKERVILDLIYAYLRPKIHLELRYIKGGGFFNSFVERKYSKKNAIYSFSVFVDAVNDELLWVRSECKTMIDDIKIEGIEQNAIENVLKDPGFLAIYESSPKLKAKVIQYASSLSSEDIIKVAMKYLNENHQFEFAFKESMETTVMP